MTMCTRPMNGFEFDQPNLALIPSTTDYGLSGMCVLMEKERAGSKLGLGEKDISKCNPLLLLFPWGWLCRRKYTMRLWVWVACWTPSKSP